MEKGAYPARTGRTVVVRAELAAWSRSAAIALGLQRLSRSNTALVTTAYSPLCSRSTASSSRFQRHGGGAMPSPCTECVASPQR